MKTKFLMAIMSFLILAACAQTTETVAPTLTDGTYRLKQFNDNAITDEYNVVFKDNRVSARFCNNSGGEYAVVGNTFSAKKMMSTLMYCAETQKNELESAFFEMADQGAEISISNTQLVMATKTNKMVFEKLAEK